LKKTNPGSSSRDSDWPASEQYLYLTTRGRRSGEPREIEIWFTFHSGRFYVIAEHATSNWVENIKANGAVRVRVAGDDFAASARLLSQETEPELQHLISGLSIKKYGWGEGLIVEILPET